MPELKIFYVLPAKMWQVKAAPSSEPIAVFRKREEARRYLKTLERIARRNKAPTSKDSPAKP
jgi:hypothetical protein